MKSGFMLMMLIVEASLVRTMDVPTAAKASRLVYSHLNHTTAV